MRAWAFAVVVGQIVVGVHVPAVAAELECGELAGRLKAGDDYRLRLELQSQKVRIEWGDDFCAEPAEAWFARNIILPRPAERGIALPPAALQAPRSEIRVRRKSLLNRNDQPLPGLQRRQGALPDLGFGASEREVAPLPIQRAEKKPKVEEAPATEPTPTEPQVVQQPVEGEPAPPVAAASGVRISNDPEGGAAKVTKYKADYEKAGLPTPPANGDAPSTPTKGVQPEEIAKPAADSAAPNEKEAETKPAFRCDRELTDFWKAGEHNIGGQKTTLTGVFTVDLDNDGRVDNVGFKIGASGRIGNVLGYYPVSKGRLSARSIPTLRLDNDDDLRRLCAGDITFSTMTLKDKQKAVGSSKRRQSGSTRKPKTVKKTAESEKTAAEKDPVEEQQEEVSAEEKTENLVFWAIIVASVFFLMGAIGVFLAIRNLRGRDEEDDDEEDDDEDEDEEDEE